MWRRRPTGRGTGPRRRPARPRRGRGRRPARRAGRGLKEEKELMASSARGDADGVDWVVVCVRRAAAGGRSLGGTGKRRTGKKLEKNFVEKICD